jgi:hypothetical protein
MKLSVLIKELQSIEATYGDVECQLQDDRNIRDYPDFFIVPELYDKETRYWIVNLRTWPY